MNPIDIRTETIFTLLRLPAARSRPRDWWTLAALAVIGWLGAVAFLGRRLPRRRARYLGADAADAGVAGAPDRLWPCPVRHGDRLDNVAS
jgi:hypothetical protein